MQKEMIDKDGEKVDTLRNSKAKIKHSHPLIALGKRQLALLRYLYDHQEPRLNIKEYSRISGVSRSSVYYYLDQLTKKRLITLTKCSSLKYFKINDNGVEFIRVSNGGVSNSRSECRKEVSDKQLNLSTHYLKYKLTIKDRTNFSEDRVGELNPLRWKGLDLVNQRILYIHFENSTIIIHPKTVFIRIHDILAENVEDADIRAFNQALKHIVKLNKIGLYEETISLEDGHFARIESVLAEFLQKIDKKYKLDLGNGKKFWIDNSNNNLEDETDDPVARKRIDNNLTEMAHNDINLTDIEKMKSLVGDLIKLETIKATQPIEQINKKEDIKPIEKLDYVG